MVLICVVLITETLVNLANKVQVAISCGLVAIHSIVLSITIVSLPVVLVIRTAILSAFALICFQSETCNIL